MQFEASREKSLSRLTYDHVRKWAKSEFDEDVKGGSHYIFLGDAISRSVTEYVESDKHDPRRDGDWEMLLDSGLRVLSEVMHMLGSWNHDNEEKDEFLPKAWRHQQSPIELIMLDKRPTLDRSSIESSVDSYLQLPYRVQRLDRMFVDMLVATELFAYAEHAKGYLKRATPFGWIKGRFNSGLACFGAAAVAASIWPDTSTRIWSAATILWVTLAVLTLMALFRESPQRKLIMEMNGVYCELNSDGPFSARHIEERAKAATAKGVVWPAPLFALLDDIQRRSGRF